MLILKYIILFLIFLGVAFIGNIFSRKYKNRVEELKSLKEAYNILESKIKFTYEPLADIFEEISDILKNKNNIYKIFRNTSIGMKNNDFQTAWENSINENRANLNFNEQDIKVLQGLGNMLGKTDVQGQLGEINLNMNFIDTQIREAENEQIRNEKMHRSLGTIIGLAIVIILI